MCQVVRNMNNKQSVNLSYNLKEDNVKMEEKNNLQESTSLRYTSESKICVYSGLAYPCLRCVYR